MTFLSARSLVSACLVSAAAVAALATAGPASAVTKTKTDLGEQCSGVSIEGLGSTFQAPAQKIWNPDFNKGSNAFACSGSQGSKGKPEVVYNQGSGNTGSGACLHDFGSETASAPKYTLFPFCGTDEAPSPTQKTEIEKNKTGGASESLETIPVLQGSVALIVHLPEGCKAESEVTPTKTKIKLGRLVFDDLTVEGIYAGTIRTWKQAIEAQGGDGNDSLTCKVKSEEEDPISVVVRLDKSGTTHIFKSWLAQVYTKKINMEAFNEPEAGKKPCGAALSEEEKTWAQVQEGCENQRWPKAAGVVRPSAAGNPAVIEKVASTASSIGYGDLAVVREKGSFSAKGQGGENKKGSASKVGEQNTRFWAEIQNTEIGATPVKYADPSSDGDVEKVANSNCAGTVYASKPGEKFPPKSTRESWFAAKAEIVQKKYGVCGLTYDLALREYKFYIPAASLAQATTTENYLLWEVNGKTGGGGKEVKTHDYEKLSGTVLKEAETGVKEIGYEVG